MKKVLIVTFAVILMLLIGDYLVFYEGILYIPHFGEVTYHSKVDGEKLYIDNGNGFEEFEIKGVNMGLSKPGYYATEDAITEEEYLIWFKQIKDMGANVVRVHTVAPEAFYEAFYKFNKDNAEPLYLIQGVSVDEYLLNSIYGAHDKEFYEPFLEDCKKAVDVVHGRYKARNENAFFPYHYDKDISPWLYGYILGADWENNFVVYTNNSFQQMKQYDGEYLYTENAANFEIFLAKIGDQVISYEVNKYGMQSVLAFSNWANTDPLEHDDSVERYFKKAAKVDVEKIKCKETFLAGQFASYHVYTGYPDFYSILPEHEDNTYLQYLTDLNEHHTMPVVIAEFGASSSRALCTEEEGVGRNQGGINEVEQGNALVSMYDDIMKAGSSGGIVSEWQDEWYKKTWNTVAGVNLESTAYWSNYQVTDQGYGLLSFEPGKEKNICYVDGRKTEWSKEDFVTSQSGTELYMKSDEKFVYFLAVKEDFDLGTQSLYIPINTTPKSGSMEAENLGITMNEKADFVIEITGNDESRIWVQERYDTLSALFYEEISAHNFFSKTFPALDSATFVPINLLMQKELYFEKSDLASAGDLTDKQLSFEEYDIENPYHYTVTGYYETGHLTYGNANPASLKYNSLADYCIENGVIEIRIPWQLLNFADPINGYIHDDYYEKYGVEYLRISDISVGVGTGEERIFLATYELEEFDMTPEYHERLKESYYILRDYWKNN